MKNLRQNIFYRWAKYKIVFWFILTLKLLDVLILEKIPSVVQQFSQNEIWPYLMPIVVFGALLIHFLCFWKEYGSKLKNFPIILKIFTILRWTMFIPEAISIIVIFLTIGAIAYGIETEKFINAVNNELVYAFFFVPLFDFYLFFVIDKKSKNPNSSLYNLIKDVLRKHSRSKWIVKYLVILVVSIILTAFLVPYGLYHYFIINFTDYHVIYKVPQFTNFSNIWSFTEGKIVNDARENYIFPDDPLEFKVMITNPQNIDRNITSTLTIFKGGEMQGKPIHDTWLIERNYTFLFSQPFFLKEEGTYTLNDQFIFDNNLPGSHPNHTIIVENIQVESLSNKLLADSNTSNFWSYVAILFSSITGNVISMIYLRKQYHQTEKQLKTTEREVDARLKAELEVSVADSSLTPVNEKWEGMVKILVKNTGNISARKVRVHFRDPNSSMDISQLVKEEQEIKKSSYQIPGSIQDHSQYPEHIIHKTLLDKPGVYDLAIWITYDYANVKDMEFIQIVRINSQSHSAGPLYEKEDIDNERLK